jgi:hypothetical protein
MKAMAIKATPATRASKAEAFLLVIVMDAIVMDSGAKILECGGLTPLWLKLEIP